MKVNVKVIFMVAQVLWNRGTCSAFLTLSGL